MATSHIRIHMDNLISNMKEVDRLNEIHSQITKPGPGRKYAVEVLHKSGIVLLVACWEAYVEDLASKSLEFLIENSESHHKFPMHVLEKMSGRYQGLKAWELAGDGWKQALRDNLKGVLAKTTALNTPSTEQVNALFERSIGMKNFSSNWKWRGTVARTSETELDKLVSLRGSIAHRVVASQSVRKKHVAKAREFVARLATKSNNAANKYISDLTGAEPFGTWWYEETK